MGRQRRSPEAGALSIKLSQASARDAVAGDIIRCSVVKGLELHATRTGKSWMLYYRTPAGRRRPKLGTFPALSIEDARAVARSWLVAVARGDDPSQARQDARSAPTVADLATVYAQHSAENHKPSTQTAVERIFRTWIVPALGFKKVADVSPSDVKTFIDSVAKPRGHVPAAKGERTMRGGPFAANQVRAYLSGAFELIETDWFKWRPKGSNPCTEARHFTQRKRRRFITAEEFPRFATALDRLAATWPGEIAAIYAVLFSGSRVSEMADARRSDLRAGAKIILSDHKTSSHGDVRTLRLPVQTLAILERLPVCRSGKLFGESVTRHSMFRVWEKARDEAGAPDARLQDLRRTFASVAKSRGVSLDNVSDIFDHRDRRTIENYAFLWDDAAVSIVQETADAMAAMMTAPAAKR